MAEPRKTAWIVFISISVTLSLSLAGFAFGYGLKVQQVDHNTEASIRNESRIDKLTDVTTQLATAVTELSSASTERQLALSADLEHIRQRLLALEQRGVQ